jgi:DNA-binding YbaB/EbfC family protein
MFKEIGQMANLMKQLPRIKEEMEKLQQRLGTVSAEGDAGGGMVKITVNGRMEVISCSLSEEALGLKDRELLEDMIRAAVNQAIERVRKKSAEETQKMAAELGLPAGMNLPGLGGGA